MRVGVPLYDSVWYHYVSIALTVLRPEFKLTLPDGSPIDKPLEFRFFIGSNPETQYQEIALHNLSKGPLYIGEWLRETFENPDGLFKLIQVEGQPATESGILQSGEYVILRIQVTSEGSSRVGRSEDTLTIMHQHPNYDGINTAPEVLGFGYEKSVQLLLNVWPRGDGIVTSPGYRDESVETGNSVGPEDTDDEEDITDGTEAEDSDDTDEEMDDIYDYDDTLHEYDNSDVHLLILPIGSDRINRVERTETGVEVVYSNVLEVRQDTQTWLAESDSTMASLRFVAYSLGLKVKWDAATATAVIDPNGRKIQITAGQKHMLVDGQVVPMLNARGEPVEAQLIDKRMFIPLRMLGQAMEMPVRWNPQTQTAYLYITDDISDFKAHPDFEIGIVSVPMGGDTVNVAGRTVIDGKAAYSTESIVHGDVPAWVEEDSGCAMVPLRFVSYALGLKVVWDETAQTATIDPRGLNISFVEDNDVKLINGRMFLPLRVLGERLKMPVGWNPNTSTAYMYVVHTISG